MIYTKTLQLSTSAITESEAVTLMNVDVERVNKAYGGWNISVPNLYFVSGERDQWRYATMPALGVVSKSSGPHRMDMSGGCVRPLGSIIWRIHRQSV